MQKKRQKFATCKKQAYLPFDNFPSDNLMPLYDNLMSSGCYLFIPFLWTKSQKGQMTNRIKKPQDFYEC